MTSHQELDTKDEEESHFRLENNETENYNSQVIEVPLHGGVRGGRGLPAHVGGFLVEIPVHMLLQKMHLK